MVGITRIHIKSDWKTWRIKMAHTFEPVADLIYRDVFAHIGMALDDGMEVVEVTKDEAMARYDWSEGIDVILNFANGGRATLQEKILTYWDSTATIEETKTSGDPGVWYTCTAQYYFWGYARKYWDYKQRKVIDSPVIEFQDWLLADLPALRRADGRGEIVWDFGQNGHDGRRSTFRYVPFRDIPDDCVIANRVNFFAYSLATPEI